MKLKKQILAFSGILLIGFVCLHFWNANKVQWKIRLDLVLFHPETEVIDLKKYTNFEWDKVLVFRRTIGRKEIEEALGVTMIFSDRKLDLSSGMVFAKNGKIVHYEIFPFTYNKAPTFTLYPYADEEEVEKIHVFSEKEAVFHVSRIGREDGKICFLLFPLTEEKE